MYFVLYTSGYMLSLIHGSCLTYSYVDIVWYKELQSFIPLFSCYTKKASFSHTFISIRRKLKDKLGFWTHLELQEYTIQRRKEDKCSRKLKKLRCSWLSETNLLWQQSYGKSRHESTSEPTAKLDQAFLWKSSF